MWIVKPYCWLLNFTTLFQLYVATCNVWHQFSVRTKLFWKRRQKPINFQTLILILWSLLNIEPNLKISKTFKSFSVLQWSALIIFFKKSVDQSSISACQVREQMVRVIYLCMVRFVQIIRFWYLIYCISCLKSLVRQFRILFVQIIRFWLHFLFKIASHTVSIILENKL